MPPSDSSFVDPTSLALGLASSANGDCNFPTASVQDVQSAGPSRKRSRSEISSEERREARAHRNRIAAQNSRDRRKAQFSFLEKRVHELEEENRRLRAGIGASSTGDPDALHQAQQKENDELRERVRTLEKRWDAVVKALACQGLSLAGSETTSSPIPPPKTIDAVSTHVSPIPTFSIPTPSTYTSPGSPTPSLYDSSASSDDFDSTRHLARVAIIGATPPSMSLQRVDSKQIRKAWSSALYPRLAMTRARSSSTRRRPWKTSSARSSLLRPPCPQRLFLRTRPRSFRTERAWRARH